jgi:hypothetical protein
MRQHGQHEETRAHTTAPIGADRRKIAVIADDGNRVALVLLDACQPIAAGARFNHLGRTWVIRGHRHPSRVLVADPIATVRQ